jgi:hypothetical protein
MEAWTWLPQFQQAEIVHLVTPKNVRNFLGSAREAYFDRWVRSAVTLTQDKAVR